MQHKWAWTTSSYGTSARCCQWIRGLSDGVPRESTILPEGLKRIGHPFPIRRRLHSPATASFCQISTGEAYGTPRVGAEALEGSRVMTKASKTNLRRSLWAGYRRDRLPLLVQSQSQASADIIITLTSRALLGTGHKHPNHAASFISVRNRCDATP